MAKPRGGGGRPGPPLASEILAGMSQRYQAGKKLPPRVPPPAQSSLLLSRFGLRPTTTISRRKHIAPPPLASEVLAGLKSNRIAAAPVQAKKPQLARPSAAIQTLKIYPNLHPGANTPVDRENIFRLSEVAGRYRAQQGSSSRWFLPNLKYNFVTTTEGETFMHHRYRHPPLAAGNPVLYAGEVAFNNGKLSWWSNASGHYRPDDGDARQARLPMEQFYSYEKVLKGEHIRKPAPPDSKTAAKNQNGSS